MRSTNVQMIAEQLTVARRKGARISVPADQAPRDIAEGYAIQDAVVSALGSPVVGWKILPAPSGEMVTAPILASGLVAEGGTWRVTGGEPAGIELEIAYRMARDVPADASAEAILDCVASAHVVFELCQSRLADPGNQPRQVALADCVSNSGIVIGDAIQNWRSTDLKGLAGRLLVDGDVHVEGKSTDPFRALSLLPAALAGRGKRLEAGQTVITGSLIGMNWLTGRHALEGLIDGCGRVRATLHQD
jgi:2-keto-4-pentenoate hydratase